MTDQFRIPFELTAQDRQSPLWVRLLAHLKERQAEARSKNDSPTADERTTQFLRGQISVYTALIRLNDQPNPIQ